MINNENINGEYCLNLDLEQAPSLSKCYENVTIVPTHNSNPKAVDLFHGVFKKNKSIIPYAHLIRGKKFYSSLLPFPSKQDIVFTDKEVIYCGAIINQYGHFLLESLSRLWYAKECSLPIVWNNQSALFPQWVTAILDILGIKNEQIFLQSQHNLQKCIFQNQE